MPTIGGVNVGWDNTTPADTESAGLGDDRVRSLKTSLQQALDAEHNFPSGGGANTGYHVYGSARPYVGTQSVVSSSGSDGRLMYTSDSSRLFGVGSEGTVLLGDSMLLSVGTDAGISRPQRAYWACEFGRATTNSNGSVNVEFPNSGFSGVPFSFAIPLHGPELLGVTASIVSALQSASAVTFALHQDDGTARGSTAFYWFSIGTRTL